MKDKKTIIISEAMQEDIVGEILAESLVPAKEKVLGVVREIEKHRIIRQKIDDVDANGFPSSKKSLAIADSEGQPLKQLSFEELAGMLGSLPEIRRMFKDDNDRMKFLLEVIKYWFDNKIQKNGLLPVNFIK